MATRNDGVCFRSSVIAQETTDRTLEKTRVTKEAITVFTGKPPKDVTHIYDVKTLIENHPHPNVRCTPVSFTLPTGYGGVWERMTDWNNLTPAEQDSTKGFLMERFSAHDLELAFDEFYPRYGKHPTIQEYRVFILNWEVQMKEDLRARERRIQHLTGEISRRNANESEQAQHTRQQNDTIVDLRKRLHQQEMINRDVYAQIAALHQLTVPREE